MSYIPESLEEITPQWLTSILFSDDVEVGKVSSVTVQPLGEGEGFIGQLARLRIAYKDDVQTMPQSLILKLASSHEGARGFAQKTGFYMREVRFYKEIAPNVGIRVPRLYHGEVSSDGSRFILVLEDMAPMYVGDSLQGCDISEVEAVICTMAALHAAWWGKDMKDGFTWVPEHDKTGDLLEALYGLSFPKLSPEMPASLREFGERLDYQVVKTRLTTSPQTLIHGDCKGDNMFFTSPATDVSVAVVDWQRVMRGPGVLDIASFLITSVQVEVVQGREAAFLKLYHSELLNRGVRDYSFEQCHSDYRFAIADTFASLTVAIANLDLEGSTRGIALRSAAFNRLERAIAVIDI
jgi:hypothetical protein